MKHFRGKITAGSSRRIHQTPSTSQVGACQPWLAAELAAVRPRVVVTLGASAAAALFGSAFRVTAHRGEILAWPPATGPFATGRISTATALATIHPSAVLRAGEDRAEMYGGFVEDLRLAAAQAASGLVSDRFDRGNRLEWRTRSGPDSSAELAPPMTGGCKDPITSPLRAPFTTFEGTSAPAELKEEVRGHGLQHSIGELVTCPMCLGQWVATAFTLGLIIAPTTTRLVTGTLTAVSGADFLQYVYARLQQAAD